MTPYTDHSFIGIRDNLAIFHDVVPHIPEVGELVYVNTHNINGTVLRRSFQYDDAYLDEETGTVKPAKFKVFLSVGDLDD